MKEEMIDGRVYVYYLLIKSTTITALSVQWLVGGHENLFNFTFTHQKLYYYLHRFLIYNFSRINTKVPVLIFHVNFFCLLL